MSDPDARWDASDMIPDPEPLIAAIVAKLLVLLGEVIEDPDMVDAIAPVIRPLVDVALAEGQAVAEHTLVGLTGSDPYPHWAMIIKHASGSARINIMETQRQAAIRDTLKKIQREQKQADALSLILKALFIIIPLLL